ncbi:hypothetical protein HF563_03480 [Acidithiobacillus ferridurans]|nr:hypothetical protein [Acidithiobacillus ferridurans]
MFHSYVPTLEAPDDKSPEWYRSYHSLFYMSQLVNSVLLSYMQTYIDVFQKQEIINQKYDELVKSGIIAKPIVGGEEVIIINDEEAIYSIDIEMFLTEIVESFRAKTSEMSHMLLCAGVKMNGYLERSVNVDLNDLLTRTDASGWFEVVKGFLNIWEFLFLFAVTESTLKGVLKKPGVRTLDLLSELNKQFPSLSCQLLIEHRITPGMIKNIWSTFSSVRNLYAHTHGILAARDKIKILAEAARFREEYDKSFHVPNDSSSLLLDLLMPHSDSFFSEERLVEGKFYLLRDPELNIFRNFISECLYELSKICSQIDS